MIYACGGKFVWSNSDCFDCGGRDTLQRLYSPGVFEEIDKAIIVKTISQIRMPA